MDLGSIVSYIFNIFLGGTTVFGFVQWKGEKKLREIAQKKEEKELDTQTFEALVRQIKYQEELIEKYIENKKKSDVLEEERTELIKQMKGNLNNLELKQIDLQRKLKFTEDFICKNMECKVRVTAS